MNPAQNLVLSRIYAGGGACGNYGKSRTTRRKIPPFAALWEFVGIR
jgi:hypothetical protein